MNRKTILILIASLLLLTAIAAVIHLTTRTRVPEHSLLVISGEKQVLLDIDKLKTYEVSGTVINGKGEEKQVQGQAVSLLEIVQISGLEFKGSNTLAVCAGDEFAAAFTYEEVTKEGQGYLIIGEDKTVTSVFFGDKNAKRNVKNVERIEIR